MVRILQLTDMHLFAELGKDVLGVNTHQTFTAVLEDVYQKIPNPDLLLLTGDLSQDESAQAYERIALAVKPLQCPTYWIPGNHDDIELMNQIFYRHHIQQRKQLIVGDWNLILLNSKKGNVPEGLLSSEQLDYLDEQLSMYPEHHTILFLHHHPLPLGSEWLDKSKLQNADAFWVILQRYHHIKAVVFGHVHQEFEATMHGVPVFSTPSTCFQFKPKSKKFALDHIMPGYRIIELHKEGIIKTWVERTRPFEIQYDDSKEGY